MITELGDPVTFYQRHFKNEWWSSVIQSYAQCRLALRSEGLHQHHLIPKSLFSYGPSWASKLTDYIPSVPLSQGEHLGTLHPTLNEVLKTNGLWQRHLSTARLEDAIDLAAKFYQQHSLRHFATAIRRFRKEAYDRVKAQRRCLGRRTPRFEDPSKPRSPRRRRG